MTIRTIDATQCAAARVAGVGSLLMMAIVIVAHYGINQRLIVPGDAVTTSRNILAHEALFRMNIACDVLYVVGLLVVLTAFYAILAPVRPSLALLGAFFRLIYASTWMLTAISLYVVLRLLHGPAYLSVLGTGPLQAWARFCASGGFEAYYTGLPFFGLASTVCSYVWLESRYIPRALAVFGVISSAWCVACALAFLAVLNFGKTLDPYWYDSPLGIFEMALGVWLLFKGLKAPQIMEPHRSGAVPA